MKTMYHAEAITLSNKFINLGDFFVLAKEAFGMAWRRALAMRTNDRSSEPEMVCFWERDKEIPSWWATIREIIDLEKDISELRSFIADPKTKEPERNAAKAQIAAKEKRRHFCKKQRKRERSDKPVIVIDTRVIGKMMICSQCGTKQAYSADNTVCYECKNPL